MCVCVFYVISSSNDRFQGPKWNICFCFVFFSPNKSQMSSKFWSAKMIQFWCTLIQTVCDRNANFTNHLFFSLGKLWFCVETNNFDKSVESVFLILARFHFHWTILRIVCLVGCSQFIAELNFKPEFLTNFIDRTEFKAEKKALFFFFNLLF